MKKITLLRHAKSGWDDPVARDFDRPLNTRGEKAAVLIGKWMKRNDLRFDHVIASPAVRVIDTIDQIVMGYGETLEPFWDRRIYLASSATLIDLLREQDSKYQSILMVGHNPGMEDLALELSSEEPVNPLREILWEKFPTSALAEIAVEIDDWADLAERSGQLTRFIRPRDLDPALGPEDE